MSSPLRYVYGVEPSTDNAYPEGFWGTAEDAVRWVLSVKDKGEWWITKWALGDPESGHIIILIRFKSRRDAHLEAEVRNLEEPGKSQFIETELLSPSQSNNERVKAA